MVQHTSSAHGEWLIDPRPEQVVGRGGTLLLNQVQAVVQKGSRRAYGLAAPPPLVIVRVSRRPGYSGHSVVEIPCNRGSALRQGVSVEIVHVGICAVRRQPLPI